jgi:hypothetical protein
MASPLISPSPPFAEAARFWVKLGFISFGGPAGQIAILHREVVEPVATLDGFTVQDGNLAGGAAEGNESEFRPEAGSFGK